METHVLPPQLIAHRGYSQCFPENTLVGLEAALQAGAECIEFDVQFSNDGIPVVIHDMNLMRTTGIEGDVNQLSLKQLKTLNAAEKDRFGEKFEKELIPTLGEVLKLLKRWPKAVAFVEIKKESIDSFGSEFVSQKLLAELSPYRDQCVLISFDSGVLEAARDMGAKNVGWAIRDWNDESHQQAQDLAPDFLFANYKIVPDKDDALWPGSWQWALYDIVEPRQALLWFRRGASLIETWDVGALRKDRELMAFMDAG